MLILTDSNANRVKHTLQNILYSYFFDMFKQQIHISIKTLFLLIFDYLQSTMAKFKNSDLEVTKDDQTNINSFSKLYLKKQEL
jgi:hypothetical protein